MKKIVRLLVVLSALLLALSFTACAKKETKPTTSESSTTASSSEETSTDDKAISLKTPIDHTWGTVTVRSEWIKFDKPYIVEDEFSSQIAAVGDYLIILTDKTKLNKYKIDGDTLKLQDSWTLDQDYEVLSQGPDNTFFLSGFMSPLLRMDLNGKKIASYTKTDQATINSDGKTGLDTWPGKTPRKLTLGETNVVTEPLSEFEGYYITRSVTLNNHKFLLGSAPDTEPYKAYVLDNDYKLIQTLGSDDFTEDSSLGSIESIIETDKHYVLLDDLYDKLSIWDKNGNFAGYIYEQDLFGTNYTWNYTSTTASDGTAYIGLNEDRGEDDKTTELLIFKVSGL